MKRFVIVTCAIGAFASTAESATILNGYAFFSGGGDRGDRLAVGGGGGANADGSAIVNDGTVLTLGSGTSPDELQARPKIDVGEGGFTGTMVV